MITSVLQGKGLLKTYWLEGKVDAEIVSLFKPGENTRACTFREFPILK